MICLINHINVKKNIHALNNLLIHNFKIFEQIFKLTFAHSRWSKSVHLLINQGHHTEHTKFVNINKSKIKSCLVCIFWTLDLILQNRNLEIHDNLSKLYLPYIRYQHTSMYGNNTLLFSSSSYTLNTLNVRFKTQKVDKR